MHPAEALSGDSLSRQPVSVADLAIWQHPMLRRYSSWRRFHDGPRKAPWPLLGSLREYENAVLVAGCQRSGTTMLTRIIAQSAGFRRLSLTSDDELDAALTLCGAIDLPRGQRYCFQTTYLNERFSEYRTLGSDQRLLWVLRNPHSVVYSMVRNWRRFALNELYEGCGIEYANSERLRHSAWPWPIGPSQVEKACLSYAAKTGQIEAIVQLLSSQQVMIIDYDQLIRAPELWLPGIFEFVHEPYVAGYARLVRSDSTTKAEGLSRKERMLIAKWAEPTYRRCMRLAQIALNR